MEKALSSSFGNEHSFGFNLELLCCEKINSLEISLSGTDHLHISDILILLGDSWVDLRTLEGLQYTASSVESEGVLIYSLENWVQKSDRDFFSTQYQKDAQVKFVFLRDILIQGVLIGNRRDGLWERAKTLKVTIQTWDGKTIILWDAMNAVYPMARLINGIGELHQKCLEIASGSNSSEFRNKIISDQLFNASSKLIEAPLSELNQFNMLKVLNDFFHAYLKSVEHGEKSIFSLDITPFVKINDLLGGKYTEEIAISSVIYLLFKGEHLKAYQYLRRLIRSKVIIDLKRLESFTRQIGFLYYGYPLILTAHSFQRPLNSYTDIDLRDLIHATFEVLKKIPETVSMICYGTLLGAIRDDDFIAHDDDIDVLFIINKNHPIFSHIVEKLVLLFEDSGFAVQQNNVNEVGALPILQILDYKYPIHLDVFFGVQENTAIRMPMKQVKNELVDEVLMLPVKYLESGKFSGFPIPSNPEGFFEIRYGNTWRAADPLFRLQES
jgi:hypothetical protein